MRLRSHPAGPRPATLIAVAALALLGVMGLPALAQASGPAWTITTAASPTNFAPGGAEQSYLITVTNTGDAPAEGAGSPITIHDALPPGIKLGPSLFGIDRQTEAELVCEPLAVSCVYEGSVLPGDSLVVTASVEVSEGTEPAITNVASVTGGGAAEASSTAHTQIGSTRASFGIQPSSLAIADSTNQAGAHGTLTTAFAFNEDTPGHPAGNLQEVNVDTPPGLVGNTTAVPSCTMDEVNRGTCPQNAAVGVASTEVEFGTGLVIPFHAFVYNIKPYASEPAALAFVVIGEIPVRLDFSVRSNGDYGLHASAKGINDIKAVTSVVLTLWGVPADHNGPGPFKFEDSSTETEVSYGGRGSGLRVPFLRNPTSCGEAALPVAVAVASWEKLSPPPVSTTLPPMTGCDRLSFTPSVTVTPERSQAGAPSGYNVDLHVPQNENPDGLATPDLKSAVVSMPAGTVISPSAANGLQGCSDEQFGLHSGAPAGCPKAALIGSVKISTPLLPQPLNGDVYVGTPLCSPCTAADAASGNMVRVFIQALGAGVVVKVEGHTTVDQATGQLTTTFDENPQLPFEDLQLKLFGGARAPLANSPICGVSQGASAQLTPYSGGGAIESISPTFTLGGCGAPQFAPSFTAGTTNNQAGGFSAETVTIARSDADQDLAGVTLQTPPGLLGLISKVPLCPDAQAQSGECPSATQIGSTTVAAGPGSEPFYLGGAVYLTGPYNGAPFGLAVVVHALAGPYDLGNVVVRAAIHVDQLTGALTIISDPLPQTRDGIPLQLRTVNVNVDRAGFVFNPTSCNPTTITGTISSVQGAVAAVSARYQAAGCAALPFKPAFTALTTARTSKANGASLHVRVVSGAGQANIGKVRVALPIKLPSRLTTLQKACLAATFAANPASCPAASVVGTAKAVTPVLKSVLSGPAYLVSHGGAAFPDLVVVLQGENVTLHLVGNTNIKNGVTTSTFKALPDAPVSTFDLVLPQGPHSVLAAFGNLCAGSLNMPTEITGQNGALVKRTTKIAVTGCPRHHTKKHAAKRRAKKRKH